MANKTARFFSRISIELVPRDTASLEADLQLVSSLFNGVRTVNIPDLGRLEMRSWEGCYLARRWFDHAIPHIRARDIELDQPLPMMEGLRSHGIGEVLVVSGDQATNREGASGPKAVEVIRKFKEEMPELKVYAAIDQYRTGLRQELLYIREKQAAGADGFFTQPFFDFRLMEIYVELLKGMEVFWGVSPVLTERSQSYWENTNNVIFPKGFSATMGWNREFTQQALEFARKHRGHVYIMPIRADIRQYLKGILS